MASGSADRGMRETKMPDCGKIRQACRQIQESHADRRRISHGRGDFGFETTSTGRLSAPQFGAEGPHGIRDAAVTPAAGPCACGGRGRSDVSTFLSSRGMVISVASDYSILIDLEHGIGRRAGQGGRNDRRSKLSTSPAKTARGVGQPPASAKSSAEALAASGRPRDLCRSAAAARKQPRQASARQGGRRRRHVLRRRPAAPALRAGRNSQRGFSRLDIAVTTTGINIGKQILNYTRMTRSRINLNIKGNGGFFQAFGRIRRNREAAA